MTMFLSQNKPRLSIPYLVSVTASTVMLRIVDRIRLYRDEGHLPHEHRHSLLQCSRLFGLHLHKSRDQGSPDGLSRCPGLAYDTERSRMNQHCTDHIFVLSHAVRRIAERCSTASNLFRSVRLDIPVVVEDHMLFQEPQRRHSSNISATHEQGTIALAVGVCSAEPGSLKRT